MKPFSSFGGNLRYTDILQLDGAFSAAHINYGKSPEFNGDDGRRLAHGSRAHGVSVAGRFENVFDEGSSVPRGERGRRNGVCSQQTEGLSPPAELCAG